MKRVIRSSQNITASVQEANICENAAQALTEAMNVLADYVDESVYGSMQETVSTLMSAAASFKEGH